MEVKAKCSSSQRVITQMKRQAGPVINNSVNFSTVGLRADAPAGF
jgi:hypothetical protein